MERRSLLPLVPVGESRHERHRAVHRATYQLADRSLVPAAHHDVRRARRALLRLRGGEAVVTDPNITTIREALDELRIGHETRTAITDALASLERSLADTRRGTCPHKVPQGPLDDHNGGTISSYCAACYYDQAGSWPDTSDAAYTWPPLARLLADARRRRPSLRTQFSLIGRQRERSIKRAWRYRRELAETRAALSDRTLLDVAEQAMNQWCDRALAAEARLREATEALRAADWLITCLQAVQAKRPVRGLDEAIAGWESARCALAAVESAAAGTARGEADEPSVRASASPADALAVVEGTAAAPADEACPHCERHPDPWRKPWSASLHPTTTPER
jgi:hypothetical protein